MPHGAGRCECLAGAPSAAALIAGNEPAGLARRGRLLGVGLGGRFALRRLEQFGVALSAGARSGSARRRHFCAFALCASAFPRRRSGWLSALPRHQSDAASVVRPCLPRPPWPRAGSRSPSLAAAPSRGSGIVRKAVSDGVVRVSECNDRRGDAVAYAFWIVRAFLQFRILITVYD